MKKFIEEVGCKRMAVGLTLCLLLSAWILPVEAGTLQDIGKTGKKAAMGTEKAQKDVTMGTEKGAKGAVKGTEKAGKDVGKDIEKAGKDTAKGCEKGLKGGVKGTCKPVEKGKDTASDEEEDSPDESDRGEPDARLSGEDGEEEFEGSTEEGEQAGFSDEGTGDYEERSSEQSRTPVDFNELKGQIPGFTPSGQEESGSSEGSTLQGDRPWYEKLGSPGGGRPPSSDEDDE